MSKKSLLNLALLFIVITLASVIYFAEEKSTKLEVLSTIDANSILTINIQHNKQTTTIEKQKGNEWLITKPVSVAANNFRISSLLKLVNAPIHSLYSISEIDLASTGLQNSKTSVTFDDSSIIFGSTNPATGLRFIQMDNTAYTIEDVYFPLLTSHFGTLVSLNLLPANSLVTKLILLNQTISKDAANRWQSNLPISTDLINATINHWKNLQAFGVREYIERDSLGEVFIYAEDRQEAIRFTITDTDPWLILARPELGLEYHLDIAAYDKLIAPQ